MHCVDVLPISQDPPDKRSKKMQIHRSDHHQSCWVLIIVFFQDGRKLGYGGMQGIPMVATSPGNNNNQTKPTNQLSNQTNRLS